MPPTVHLLSIKPDKPQLGKSNFDTERLLASLASFTDLQRLYIEKSLWARLPLLLRQRDALYALIVKEEDRDYLCELFIEKPKRVLGCAIDLGSTTIAFYLYDFLNATLLEEFSIYNPQIELGEDILTRLHLARKEENLNYIRDLTLKAINQELKRLCPEDIYYCSICGNTAMTHFLLGLPVNYLIVEPYVPVIKWIPPLKARDLGLELHPEARVFVFPLAGTYFGGDLVAGLYEVELHKKEGFSFYLDVGTNAEVVLGNRDFLLACAGAAGPALEGGIFECGTRAMPGAIEHFTIKVKDKKIGYKTIGGEKPLGFCGSAVITLMAEAFLEGILTSEGKLKRELFPERIREIDGEIILLLVDEAETAHGKPIYIKESEIKSFLRSKGAMYTILSLLCEKIGLTFKDIESFYVAGSFGNHIDVTSAVVLGMLPQEALSKSYALGNAAGRGALKFLKEANFEEIRRIVDSITYIELNVEPRFMELLTGALIIPHVNMENFPWVQKLIKERRGCFSVS